MTTRPDVNIPLSTVIVTAIRRNRIKALIDIGHCLKRLDPADINKVRWCIVMKPLNMGGATVRLPRIAKLILTQQLKTKSRQPLIAA